jgi:glycosyltransferase involved in cell wall biosynthesis
MNTLQIGDDWPEERITGLNRYFVELSRYLPNAGASVRGLVIGQDSVREQTGGIVEPFARSGDPLWKRIYRARQIAQQLNRVNHIDLVASHFALYTSAISQELRRKPLVVHFHGPWSAESNVEGAAKQLSHIKFAIERNVYRRAQRLIVLSQSFQRELIIGYAIDERRIRLIPGGIDTDRFNMALSRNQARHLLGWPEDRPVILAVRRQVRRMGLENLITAMKSVVASCPDALLLLGGTGPISSELDYLIRELALHNNVKRIGRISDVELPLAYRAANVSVVPSQALEGFGLVTLESLASGTPVLVTPIGGLPEVVMPFAPECVFAGSDSSAIAALLTSVMTGKLQLPDEHSCRAYAVENFGWPKIATRVCAIYQEALGA